MTELLEDLENLKERILSERCAQELPGDSQEEVCREPPPAPPLGDPNVCDDCGAYKPKGVCDTCHPVIAPPEPEPEAVVIPVDRERNPGSSGAIFEARVYVLSCFEKSQGVNLRSVCNLTGWDNITASKFIRDIQDEYRQTQRQAPKTGRALKVNETGMANLIRAVENAPDEDEGEEEPEPGELESIEAETGTRTETGPDVPPWWTEENQRTCQQCQKLIPPKRIGATQNWEGRLGYLRREYCSRACYQKSRVRTDGTKD